jgi:hypothetical protein
MDNDYAFIHETNNCSRSYVLHSWIHSKECVWSANEIYYIVDGVHNLER